MPVRDGARWLGAAVASALHDSGPGDEVLVVDDGSRDDPAAVLPVDTRVRLLAQPPLGIAAALETGRASAKGRYIARLDCDDVVIPGRLAAQVNYLERHPEVAAVGGRACAVSDGGPVPGFMRRYVAWVNGLRDPAREILVESPMFHPATTLRASALAAVGGWRAGDFAEDYDLFLRLVEAGHGLHNLDREVLAWRDRPGRLTRVDPRYGRAAALGAKTAWLARGPLATRRRVGVWGAGKAGRPWLRWLVEQGHELALVVDIGAGRPNFVSRHGVSVRPPEALAGAPLDLLLVAVGAAGARDEIRQRIGRLRPELVEGRDWFAVA